MMKKYLLVVGVAVLLPWQSSALECGDMPKVSCKDFGYIYSGCPGNFTACPFDKTFLQCDKEGSKGDFKFAVDNCEGTGWSEVQGYGTTGGDKDANNSYVVGIAKISADKASGKCGVGINVAKVVKDATGVLEHSHSGDVEVGPFTALLWDNLSPANYGSSVYPCVNASESALSVSTSSLGTGDGSLASMTVKGCIYNYVTSTKTSGQASTPSVTPTCDSLGYKDKEQNCPGEFVRCPFNENMVMCDMEAKAGEIKFASVPVDHNGWVLCNGRALSGSGYENSELGKILKNKSKTSIPNGQALFLKITTGDTLSVSGSVVPDHKHSLTSQYPANSVKSCGTGSSSFTYSGGNSSFCLNSITTSSAEGTTSSATGTSVGDELRPKNMAAYMFIYSGKLNLKD